MEKNKKKKSLIKTCAIYFTINVVVLLSLIICINVIVNMRINRINSGIYDFLEYEDYLKTDSFSKINLKRFKKNKIIIYDNNFRTIFTNTTKDELNIYPSDIDFINNYYVNYYYMIFEKENSDGKKEYVINKTFFNENASFNVIESTTKLDENLNVIEGNIFEGKTKLTKREFELIQGYFGSKGYIEKYKYKTDNNEERLLIFFEPILSSKSYNKIYRHIYSLWFVAIPLVIIIEVVFWFIISKKIKNMITPLEKVVEKYPKISRKFVNYEVPKELTGLQDTFNSLFKRLKEEEAKRNNEEKNKYKVITNLSHDLKTPLTVIQGYSKAFKDGIVKKENEMKYIDVIFSKSVEASNIIDSLFEYSKMNHFEFKPNKKTQDFLEFCREYLASKYTELELLGYKIEFELEEKVINYTFDENLIKRLFDNIIGNSVKYNEKGTTIYFEYFIKNNEIVLFIGDNGVGIDGKIKDDIFKPFVVGDDARSSKNGTGLGLYIAKNIVDIHGGTIKLKNNISKKYKFGIEIKFKI